MNGYQVTFFTQQDRRHQGRRIYDWLMEAAKTLGIRGATSVAGTDGVDHEGKRHSASFFELADQPLEITLAMNDEQTKRLFALLEQEKVNLFYAKTAVEFGTVGPSD